MRRNDDMLLPANDAYASRHQSAAAMRPRADPVV
jgi:hypothetical protein